MAEDKKNPKEVSNIFHSIMKASVKPKKESDKDEKEAKDVKVNKKK